MLTRRIQLSRTNWLCLVTIAFLSQASAQPFEPDSNTVALYHFDEVSGNFVADASGNGNHGNATFTTIVEGLFGNARQYETLRDEVLVPNPFGGVQDEFTIEAWVYVNMLNGNTCNCSNTIFRNRQHVFDVYMTLTNDGRVHCNIQNEPFSYTLFSNEALRLHEWYHLAFTFGGGMIQIFINGSLDTARIGPTNHDWSINYIGTSIGNNRFDGVDWAFNGIIDELRISNIARTPLPLSPVTVDIGIDSLNMVVPAEGDTFAYRMTFTNLTASSQVVDVWTKVLRPIGNPIDPLYGPETLTLDPFEVIVIDTAKMGVPFDARSGEYSLIAFAGTYQSDTLDTDTTMFFKLPSVPCEDISQLKTRCRPGGTMQAKVVLTDNSHTGDRVEFTIDDVPYEVTVAQNGRALLSLTGFNPGSHDVELTEPPGCYPPVVVTCPAGLGTDVADFWVYDFVEDDDETWEIPTATTLFDNYPNPFNPSTMFRYALSEDAHVTLRVYNMIGQLVATLVDEPQPTGYRSVVWNGRNDSGASVASGIYIYRITAGAFTATKRMLFLK